MFGYRLIHKDVLDALLRQAELRPASNVTASGVAGAVSVSVPVSSASGPGATVTAASVQPDLPPPVADAVARWGVYGGAASGEAARLLARGVDPDRVAWIIANGERVDD